MKMRRLITLILVIAMMPMVYSCGESKAKKVEQLVGTYEVIDNLGTKWIIILDETVKMHIEGSNNVAYGLWGYDSDSDAIYLDMNDDPRIVFPNMEKGFFLYGTILGDYLYKAPDAVKVKNPNQRLPIKKIK